MKQLNMKQSNVCWLMNIAAQGRAIENWLYFKKNYVKKKFLNQWFSIQIADETYIKKIIIVI